MKNLRIVLFVILICLPLFLSAQFFMWGQAPASIRWKQIQTDNFQVIFPEGFEAQAGRVADVLEFAYQYGTRTLEHSPRKVSVIIHNQTVVPNGFVTWAPRRMELFTNPPQDLGASDWLDLLAIHEFRHIVQIDKLNQGITKLLSYLFGEQITGAIFGLFIPMWFVEGDAVAIETGHTIGGRGRMPVFEQGLRAQVLEKGAFSFDKAFFGSFRDHVPSFYALGYQMVSHAREEFGSDVFARVLDRFGYGRLSLRPFSGRLRSVTGLSSDKLYEQTFSRLSQVWQTQHYQNQPSRYRNITGKVSTFTQYRYPAFVNDSTIVALKTSLAKPPRVVAIDFEGHEQVLFFPGFINDHGFSASANKIVWSEQRTHPRWEHLSWSELHVFDYETGYRRRLTEKTRFFAPAISPNGEMIAVVEVNERYENALVILRASDGEEIARHIPAGGEFIFTPAWCFNSKTITVVASSATGKKVLTIDAISGNRQTLFDAGTVEISSPAFLRDGSIIFTGAFSGIDALYRIENFHNEVRKVVTPEFAARNAIAGPDGASLLWQNYSATGYELVKGRMEELLPGQNLPEVENHAVNFYRTIADQENFIVAGSNVPRKNHEIKPFRRLPAIFNLHSWSPVFSDIDDMTIGPGIGLYFQDVLSNSSMVIGYDYNLAEDQGDFVLNFNYYGWTPVAGLSATRGNRTARFHRNQYLLLVPYYENSIRFGVNLPLLFRSHDWFFGINPLVRASLTQVDRARTSPDFFVANTMLSMHYRMWAFSQRRAVARDIRPRFGNVVDLQYRHSPFGGADMGSVASARIVGFLPGAALHHSLRLSAAWQKHTEGVKLPNTINHRFPNHIVYPRGMQNRFDESLSVFSLDYALPLWLPDLSLPPLVYLKRISANLFADQAFTINPVPDDGVRQGTSRRAFYSAGIEVIANMHLLRMFSPVELGLRWVYVAESQNYAFEVFWGIDFYGFVRKTI